MLTSTEMGFLSQAEEFLNLLMHERELRDLHELEGITSRPPFPIPPVMILDYRSMAEKELSAVVRSYNELGVANIIVSNPAQSSLLPHPLFHLCEQLRDSLGLHYPLCHPLEGHPEAVSRFGPADETVKIYNLPKAVGGPGYREVAESSDPFEVHLDGLGSGGTVQTVILYMDSAPLFGGFTFFYDMLALAGTLAYEDMEAFCYLFLPDAFTAIRPRGKGAIKVTTPVLYINESGQPQVFFRKDSGEYRMEWRAACPPLDRARDFLHRHTQPFAQGSFFVPFTRPGCCCLSRNRDIAHGRTGFIDGNHPDQRRLLSRKWFMTSSTHSVYKHVPGIALRKDIAALFPDRFGPDQLVGEWSYNPNEGVNRRMK